MPPPHRPPPRRMIVRERRLVTPNMLRLTLGGPGLDDFPARQQGGYVKLRLPDSDGKMVVRTYTIRAQRHAATGTEIDVDFALHGTAEQAGPATAWAMAVRPGDAIDVGGPGPAKPLPPGRAFYFLAGDMTALPAIAVNLESLAATARGVAVVQIADPADRQDIPHPAGVELVWIVGGEAGADSTLLADHARQVGCHRPGIYAWAACEFSAMQQLRDYLRGECGLTPDSLYISSYWKAGLAEDAHKLVKRDDAEQQPA